VTVLLKPQSALKWQSYRRHFLEPRLSFIDYSTGGSIDGQIRAAEANISKVADKTIVIPGHGAVGGKADLILFLDVLVEIRDKVSALKRQGKLSLLRSCPRVFDMAYIAGG
jgi:hypothetical protein